MLSKLKRIRGILTLREAKILTDALVLSRIRYCAHIYGIGASGEGLHELEIAYKRVLRVVANVRDGRFPSEKLYEITGLPPLDLIINSSTIMIAHKVVCDSGPPYLRRMYMAGEGRIPRMTRAVTTNKLFCAHRFKTACQNRSVGFVSAHSWNLLSDEVRAITNVKRLRKIIETCT